MSSDPFPANQGASSRNVQSNCATPQLEAVQLLEALPGPAWLVEFPSLRIQQRNAAASLLSGGDEFPSFFSSSLDQGLIARLQSPAIHVGFHAVLAGEESPSLFSATRLGGEPSGLRLILAQLTSFFDVPTQITFDELLDSAFEGIVILDSERRIVQTSVRFQQMFGYSIEELRGKSPAILVPPGCEQEFAASIERLNRGGIHRLETRRLRRDGSLIEVLVDSQPISSGRFRGGSVVIYSDLTEVNRDARYRNLRMEATRILATASTVDEAGRELCPALAEALGWDVVRLWQVDADGLRCTHEHCKVPCACDEHRIGSGECTVIEEVVRNAKPFRRDNFQPVSVCAGRPDCILRNGTQVCIPIVDSQKQVLGVLEMLTSHRQQKERGRRELLEGICAHLAQFITRCRAEQALAENEAKFRTLAETAPAAIFIHADGIILYANVASELISGYTREETLNRPIWSVIHPEDLAFLQESAKRRLRGDDFKKRWEARIIHKSGEVRWIDCSGSRITIGNRPAVLCVGFDITEQRALEIQLRQTQKMEAVGRLAGGIAHDFNNLLMVIGCCSEDIQQHPGLPPEVRQGAQEINHAANRAAALTRQLLAFSRHQVLAPKVVDLNAILTGTELILRRALGDDIALHFSLEAGLGPILADPSQVEQVMMNLAVNSRDAMPDGGTLTISTTSETLDEADPPSGAPRGGAYAVLTVTDDGVGMNPEIQQHIFEPFFSTKNASKGTGLGLSTVYGIVKQSNGFITVDSLPNRGATFRVFFPIARGTAAASLAMDHSAEIQAATATILLVEDEDDVRAVLRNSLRRDGYTILEASGGAEALEISKHAGRIDLLLTDVVMPGMSGRDLADRLAGSRPGMKILYVSGYNEDTVLQKGVIEGQMEFLQKPFSPSTLSRKIRQILSR